MNIIFSDWRYIINQKFSENQRHLVYISADAYNVPETLMVED